MAVVYGGRSGEHEVSVESARSVIEAMDSSRYEVLPIGITHDGLWLATQPAALANPHVRALGTSASSELGSPALALIREGGRVVGSLSDACDVVFPLVHGTFGEDGCLQGLFELAALPYVGAPVYASAVGMDKILMKMVFGANDLPVVDYVPVERADWERDPIAVTRRVEEQVGYPCFVKPANLGSSVGISKVRRNVELETAIAHAAQFSSRLIVERALNVREIECGILGNDDPVASVVGEVIPSREFYDYEAKYRDLTTRFVIPAELGARDVGRVQDLAIRAFKAVGGAGMARVDFFLGRADGEILVNEINTIPGFTSMSVYPRLWEASDVSYPTLIDRLIQLAVDRHSDQARNRTQYEE